MKKQKTLLTITFALVLSFIIPLTAQAAPQKMADGTMFDPQYYAKNNPDVVAALGTTAQALYQHYVDFGKKEGRRPTGDKESISTGSFSVLTMPDGQKFDPTYYASNIQMLLMHMVKLLPSYMNTIPNMVSKRGVNHMQMEIQFPIQP